MFLALGFRHLPVWPIQAPAGHLGFTCPYGTGFARKDLISGQTNRSAHGIRPIMLRREIRNLANEEKTGFNDQHCGNSLDALTFSDSEGHSPYFSLDVEARDLEWMFEGAAIGENPTEVCPSISTALDDEDLIGAPFQEKDGLFPGSRPGKSLHWSVPWSDLMMTMFIFFAVLYVFSASKQQALSEEPKRGMILPPLVKEGMMGHRRERLAESNLSMTKIYDMSRETVRAKALGEFASIELTPDKTVSIILKGDLLFETGKAELMPEAKRSLREIGEILRQTRHVVNLVGHTDDVPIHSERFPTNWELSAARACAVARYLIDDMGLSASRFFISGYGENQPLRPNDTCENRAANRRVEIIITKEKPYKRLAER
ncbi:MAG: flagellar motor protein MotB [Deltaproteobacteria bacterium]|nr:flagellar motor protein MotB [Deltaproteobacteria bacterium]